MTSTRRILFITPAHAVTRIFPLLKDQGFEVCIAENVKGALAFHRKEAIGTIFSRPSLPGYDVEELLELKANDAKFPPIIIVSDKPRASEAEHYLQLGAQDYWIEPLDLAKVVAACKMPAAQTPKSTLSTLGGVRPTLAGAKIVGSHISINRVLALAKQVAQSKATVLVSGESGTGKEIFARYLHEWSGRSSEPFIAVNCAALPEHLLESELFGHEKGSFTGAVGRKLGKFELANGGTILLDEISEMDLALQAKLLRVLQEGEVDRVGGVETIKVDVRVIATTNRKLDAWVKEGKFRQDLFFRLNVIPLRLPSLKERGEDVIELANYFIGLYIREYALIPTRLSEKAEKWLMQYDFPGNVRELQNLMERAVLLTNGKPIEPEHFLLDPDSWPVFLDDTIEDLVSGDKPQENNEAETQGILTNTKSAEAFSGALIPLHEMERLMILRGLDVTSGNRTQAAEILGISVRTLRNKLNEYRLQGLNIE